MSLLLIDFEATGKDPKEARILEIGAMLVDDSFNEPLAGFSQLVWESGYPALTEEVSRVTGLTQDLLSKEGVNLDKALYNCRDFFIDQPEPDFIIAYNRQYDEILLKSEYARRKWEPELLTVKPWLCAMMDVEESLPFKVPKKLMYLSLDHGVAVDPSALHRAINDVELMRKMLKASGTTAQKMYEYQRSPWVYVRALVRKPWEDDGKSTSLAKAQGFSWEKCFGDESGRVFDKCWVKRVKEKDVQKELSHEFKVVRLE